jgi:hypothetical protein
MPQLAAPTSHTPQTKIQSPPAHQASRVRRPAGYGCARMPGIDATRLTSHTPAVPVAASQPRMRPAVCRSPAQSGSPRKRTRGQTRPPDAQSSHPRTPVRGSPNRTPKTEHRKPKTEHSPLTRYPPLAPVKRGRGVGGEGAKPPWRNCILAIKHASAVRCRAGLGLESPSYGEPPSRFLVLVLVLVLEHRPLRFPSRLRVFA